MDPSLSNKRSAEEAGLSSNSNGAAHVKSGESIVAAAPVALLPVIRSRIDALIKAGEVQEGDLDERVLEKLSTVSEEGGLIVLTQFEHALSNGTIRNKSAYLNGVIKSHQVASRMQPDLNQRLEELYKTNKLNGQELDSRCMDHLGSLSGPLANRALDAFLAKDLSSARNISALFMSTLRQLEHNVPVEHNHFAGNPQSRPYGGRDNGSAISGYSGGGPSDNVSPYAAVYNRPFQGDARFSQNRDASGPDQAYGRPPPILMNSTYPNNRDSGLKHYGAAQSEYRVRVDEFHLLSVQAVHVHPAAAFRLQDLWDRGGKLVAELDEGSWSALVHLPPADQLTVIDEVHDKMKAGGLRNVNALFTSMCKHLMGHKGNAPQPQSYGSNGGSHFNNQFAPPASHFNNQSGPRGGGGFQQGGPVNNQREGRPPPPGAVSSSLEPGSDKHIQMLPPMLRDAVVAMLRDVPFLKPHHIDEPIVEKLLKMPPQQAFDALAELGRNNLGTVRNIPAYIMGIIKRTNNGGPPLMGAR